MTLFSPLQVGGSLRMENRIALTAMVTRLSGEDGRVNQDIIDRYVRYAKGEPGLIIAEAMAVHDTRSGPLLRICDDGFVRGLQELARAVHETSPSKIVPQIIHFLKVSRSGWRQTVDMLSAAEIDDIVERYAAAAARARQAGMDGVELHMAHAYTLSSFLSKRNGRSDAYGRTLEGRMRLMGRVITAVRQAVGPDFTVGVRFNGDEAIKGGYSVGEAQHIALRMAQLGLNYISLSAGGKFEDAIVRPGQPPYPYTGYSGDRCMPPAGYPDGCNLYMARAITPFLRRHGVQTPVLAGGKIATRELAEQVLAEGSADMIGMARGLLADPDLPRKWRDGEGDKVVRCIYSNVCKQLDENFKKVVCGLWPRGALHAPDVNEHTLPAWPGGANLAAKLQSHGGAVRLSWDRAADDAGVQGYDIFRSADGESWQRIWADIATGYTDVLVVSGKWHYQVQAYDASGNRSPMSNIAAIEVPLPDYRLPAAGG